MRILLKNALVLLVIALGVLAPFAAHYGSYAGAALDARSRAHQLTDQLAQLQIGDLDVVTVERLHGSLTVMRQDVAVLEYMLERDELVGFARNVVGLRTPLDQAASVLAAAGALGHAGDIGLTLAARLAGARAATLATGGESLVAALVELMASSTAEVDEMHELIAGAGVALTAVPPDAPGTIRDPADLMRGGIERYGPLLEQYRSLDDTLPAILGRGSPRRYLVLAQDPAELRPTGGYIGTVGIVALRDGTLSDRSFQDVLKLDLLPGLPYVEPPSPLANHLLGSDSWLLADANWSPDFPTAAQDALRLYTLETGDSDIDGVLALTTYAIDRILEATGPLAIPEYGVTVPAGSVTLVALAMTRPPYNTSTDRKAFLDDLASAVIQSVYALPPSAWPDLVAAFSDISERRQMLAWFKDPAAQALVATTPLGGAVRHDPGDYVYVVEANVAPTSKYNVVVDRRDALAVVLDRGGNASSTLSLSWQNNSLTDGQLYQFLRLASTSPAGLYGAYVRVYVPEASELGSTTGMALDPIQASESITTDAGHSVFGNYLLMGPGRSELALNWTTPGVSTWDGSEWAYALTIQKQPGLRPLPVSVTVALPPGATISSVEGGASAANGQVTFSATLDQDVQLLIRYRLP